MVNTVLIVDDDSHSDFITRYLLEPMKLCRTIESVSNGQAAIDWITERNRFPDVIILDNNMPLVNGSDFLAYITDNNLEGRTSIIMCSTSVRDDVVQARTAHPDVIAYLFKPLHPDTISEAFAKITPSVED